VEDWASEHRANRDYEAYRARGVMKDGRRFGCPPRPYEPPAQPEGKINTTDPDARRMEFGRGDDRRRSAGTEIGAGLA
jgi:hypothetical protein